MSYIEATLKTELVTAFTRSGCICHKFPDLARGVKKPHDLVCGIGGLYVGIETKLVKVGTTQNPGRWHDELIVVTQAMLSPNQRTALRETERCGSVGLVVGAIYDRYDGDRQAYSLPYHEFLTRDVWTLADCRRLGILLFWQRGLGWDVEELVQGITGTPKENRK